MSRIAGKNCFLFGEDAMHTAACTHGGEGRQGGAFGDYDVASQPDVVGKGDGAVGVEMGAGAVDEAMLVGVHDGTRSQQVFDTFLTMLAGALNRLGYEAVTTAHNDVLVDGFKVSGNAFFSLPSCSIVHGTLLHSVDMDALARAITPSAEKLGKHGVQSVRQRVTNLVDLGLELGADGLEAALIPAFCDSERILGASDIQSVKDIEKSYTEPAFILGKAR